MSSPVANGDAGVIFNCPALTELYGVTASQSLPDGRYVVPAAWRCGGTSGKLQAADGVKASVSLCAILCGIVPSFPTPNVMKSQGISQIHPKRSEKPQPELQPQEIMKRQKIVKLNCSEAKPSVGHENGAGIQNRNSFTLLEFKFSNGAIRFDIVYF